MNISVEFPDKKNTADICFEEGIDLDLFAERFVDFYWVTSSKPRKGRTGVVRVRYADGMKRQLVQAALLGYADALMHVVYEPTELRDVVVNADNAVWRLGSLFWPSQDYRTIRVGLSRPLDEEAVSVLEEILMDIRVSGYSEVEIDNWGFTVYVVYAYHGKEVQDLIILALSLAGWEKTTEPSDDGSVPPFGTSADFDDNVAEPMSTPVREDDWSDKIPETDAPSPTMETTPDDIAARVMDTIKGHSQWPTIELTIGSLKLKIGT